MFDLPDIRAKIGLDLNPLKSKFEQAQGDARGFTGKFGSLFSSLGKTLASPMVAFAAATGAAVAAAASVHSIISKVSQALEDVDNAGKASDRLGLTTEAFIALKHEAALAGVEMGTIEMAVNKMQQAMADAASGNADAGKTFKKLGLDAGELVNLPTEQALGKIGDALKTIENPAQRAAAATDIFGMRAGPQLQALLLQGTAGIEAAKAEAEKLGISFSRVDAAKVEAANDAWTKVHEVIAGVAQQVSIALAPYLEAVANQLVDAGTQGEGFGEKATRAIEWVVSGIAYLSDYLSLAEAGWKGFEAVTVLALAESFKAIDSFGHAIADVLGLVGIDVKVPDTFAAIGDALTQQAGELANEAGAAWDDFDKGKNQQAVGKFFQGVRDASEAAAQAVKDNSDTMRGSFDGAGEAAAAAMKKYETAIDDLQGKIDTFGMSDLDKTLFEMKGDKSLGADQIAEIEKRVGKLKELTAGAGLKGLQDELNNFGKTDGELKLAEFQKSGALPDQIAKYKEALDGLDLKKYEDELKSPAEKAIESYDEAIKRLSKWREEGKITSDEFKDFQEREKEKLKDAGDPLADKANPQLAGFIRAGSQEALKLQFASQRDTSKDEIPRKHLAVAQDQARDIREINQRLDLEVVA